MKPLHVIDCRGIIDGDGDLWLYDWERGLFRVTRGGLRWPEGAYGSTIEEVADDCPPIRRESVNTVVLYAHTTGGIRRRFHGGSVPDVWRQITQYPHPINRVSCLELATVNPDINPIPNDYSSPQVV